ncbi:glucose 1-dehydrogenase [Orrella sp. JC864]|uniref:SDR family NAD(P)-dependent oxidoreductase n=1 Tax=Orrella sp. JC864 TaxID=3120298 RepID=UPI0012BD43DE
MSGNERKVAVVTGAARGIGLACAQRLSAAGYAVALADQPGPALEQAVQALRAQGRQALALAGDVSDHGAVQAQGQYVLAQWGHVDALVNNAGISQPKTLLEISEAEWDRTIAVNLKGYFNWCKALAPAMLARRSGRIVNISSVSANTGAAPSAVSKFAYCSAKAGVLGMTRGLAKELAPAVAVNAICPGSIRTDLTEQLIQSRQDDIVRTIPLGRIGTPMDVAVVVEFLVTVEPNYMTGEVIDVDGGQWVN